MVSPAPASPLPSLMPAPHFIEMILLGLGQAGFSSPYDSQGAGHALGARQNLLELRIYAFQGFLAQLFKEQFGKFSSVEIRFFEKAIRMFAGSFGLVFHFQTAVHGYVPFSSNAP
jgi:hypothetical protein